MTLARTFVSQQQLASLCKKVKYVYKGIFRYSGLEYIFRMFVPAPKHDPLPTGFLWLVGIYLALFGIAAQRYQNAVHAIESRTEAILVLLGTNAKKAAIGQISRVQNMKCPSKPHVFNPIATFCSLFAEGHPHFETVESLKAVIEMIKTECDSAYLPRIDLSTVDLRKGNFTDATLRESNLHGTDFGGALLCRANLAKANLAEANLCNADLRGSKLRHTNLSSAFLSNADLSHAFALGADLEDAHLSESNLNRCVLEEAILRKADVREASMVGAILTKADLAQADLRLAQLDEAILTDASLRGADLGGATLRSADLTGADLRGAQNVTINQLLTVATLYRASLDEYLVTAIRHNSPELLVQKKSREQPQIIPQEDGTKLIILPQEDATELRKMFEDIMDIYDEANVRKHIEGPLPPEK